MKKTTIIFLKVLVWIACLYPLAKLVYGCVTGTIGPDATQEITFSTGHTALRLLILSLAITPLRQLWSRLSWLIKFRRLLGLFAFFYASLHLFAYVGLYNYFERHMIIEDILRRRFVTAGVLAWLLLFPLAVTSTTGWIKRLGGKNWQRLHKLVYVTMCLAIVHYWWLVKPGVISPLKSTIAVVVLLGCRPILNWWKSSRRKTKPYGKAA